MPRPKNEKGGRQPGKAKKSSAKLGGGYRNDFEREQDRAVIATMHVAGKTDQEIADALSAERDYTLARRTIAHERYTMLDNFYDTQMDKMQEKIDRELEKINRVEEEAWSAYMLSLEKSENVTSRELTANGFRPGEEGKKEYVERELTKTTSAASPSYHLLNTILKCIDQRSRLEGLYKYQIEINKTENVTHHVKMYQVVSPEDWDEIEEGEYESV